MPSSTTVHARLRTVIGAGAGLALVCSGVLAAAPAHADRGPSYPSADDIAAASGAVASAESRVAALDARLADARTHVADLAEAASVSDMTANSARGLLAHRTTESAQAQATAQAAGSQADQADLSLSMYAAQVYQLGAGSLGTLDLFLGSGGPQDAVDRASGIAAVGDEHARLVSDASASRYLADASRRAAGEALARQHDAAVAADRASAQARADAGEAATQTRSLQAQMDELVRELAGLRQTSSDLEQQRQAGIAAQQEARRVEAIRQAAIAAAQEAARQAAAAAAAQAAAAAVAEQAARSAREAAAANAARQIASTPPPAPKVSASIPAPRTPVSPPAPSAPTPVRTVAPPVIVVPPSSGKPPLNLANAAMWDRVAVCESSSNWHINTGNGYYGGLQFNSPTWLEYGGADYAPRADLASREEQITVANRLYAKRGLQPWECGWAA